MADRKSLQADQISGHTGPSQGYGVQRDLEVCKLIDTTTCIGCKACEVACVEWNDMPFQPTTFDNTYQTMPKTNWNFWNLIKFNEHQNPDGTIQWLMRKDQCMHCADPGCLAACPADGAIVKYSNGIVDFNQENCIGCEYLRLGLSVRHSALQPDDEKSLQVHALLRSRRPGPGTRVHQGVSHRLPEIRQQGRHELHRQRARQTTARSNFGFQNAGVYDPPSVGGTHVIYVLHDATDPERYGGLPKNPTIPWSYTVWKWLFKPVLGTFALFGFLGVLAHYVTSGPRRSATRTSEEGGTPWLARAIERFDDKARQKFESMGRTTVYRGELLRHPVYTRVIHWTVALFFFLALFTGFGIYLPWLFRWFTPFFGGGPLSRIMHPWFGVGFVFFFGLQALNWLAAHDSGPRPTRTGCATSSKIVSGEAKMDPPDTGFFNAGQKVQFWEIVGGCVVYHDHRHHSVGGRQILSEEFPSPSATSSTTSPRSSCSAESSSTSIRAPSASPAPSRR